VVGGSVVVVKGVVIAAAVVVVVVVVVEGGGRRPHLEEGNKSFHDRDMRIELHLPRAIEYQIIIISKLMHLLL